MIYFTSLLCKEKHTTQSRIIYSFFFSGSPSRSISITEEIRIVFLPGPNSFSMWLFYYQFPCNHHRTPEGRHGVWNHDTLAVSLPGLQPPQKRETRYSQGLEETVYLDKEGTRWIYPARYQTRSITFFEWSLTPCLTSVHDVKLNRP